MTVPGENGRTRNSPAGSGRGAGRSEHDTLHTTGDFRVPANAMLHTGFSCDGDARIGAGAHVDGDVRTGGSVTLGAGARVAGTVRAKGPVTWNPGASAAGLDADGAFHVGEHALAGSLRARHGVDWSEEAGP